MNSILIVLPILTLLMFDLGLTLEGKDFLAHLQSSVFKLSKDLIDSIHEEGIVAYTS